ncbi:hypothetical protein BGY98DRAFT_1010717, partial [Russula aff. rugulosa BPL654]
MRQPPDLLAEEGTIASIKSSLFLLLACFSPLSATDHGTAVRATPAAEPSRYRLQYLSLLFLFQRTYWWNRRPHHLDRPLAFSSICPYSSPLSFSFSFPFPLSLLKRLYHPHFHYLSYNAHCQLFLLM